MSGTHHVSRRDFLVTTGAAVGAVSLGGRVRAASDQRVQPSHEAIGQLRRDILDSPLSVALHRAQVFTSVFQQHEQEPWIVRKAMALREYFRTVPLYVRDHDLLAGSICETPGGMPLLVELGIGENAIYTNENPGRKGYLHGKVPEDIREYWMNRNMWGQYRTEILKKPPYDGIDEVPQSLPYKFISNQGHLSPNYGELLQVGIDGVRRRVARRKAETDSPEQAAFLTAAEESLRGLSEWIVRYADFLEAESQQQSNSVREAELKEMSRTARTVAEDPPATFRQALQLIWLVHQAIHIEGHGYSCTPDHIDQLLWPFYQDDMRAGRLDVPTALRLIENFVLKMYDNSFWGPEHHLTQGLCLSGCDLEGHDLTNRLTWLFLEGATNLSLPEPLVWIRWHPQLDQEFFDFCLSRLERSTCFPMIWNAPVVAAGLQELGVAPADAVNFIAVGCNELAIPGQMYFNPGANVSYLQAIEATLTSGKGYKNQWKWSNVAPPVEKLATFDQFASAVGSYMRRWIENGYQQQLKTLEAQMRWGQTPLTSCFFDGCIKGAQDLTQGTKYNVLSCGGTAFANAVDSFAAIRQVVYTDRQVTLAEVAEACSSNFSGRERLRAKLLAAPKHGNDDPAVSDIVKLVERLRDEPMKEICRDPRDGSRFGNCHVVRSSAVTQGLVTAATPDGRLAGTPLASSVAAAVGCEHHGPTAVLNSVCKLNAPRSWQCGYQVNIRFYSGVITDPQQRDKLRAMLNVYFQNGGQELQINVVGTEILRAAQKNPELYSDVVVRVAGFSEFFVNLTPEMQEDIIARAEHR